MQLGEYAIYVSLGSLLVSMTTFTWNVVSWRRAGSHLRVHALLYREVLLIWVFNAGRISDQVERIEIGGRRGGIGGFALSPAVEAPFKLAAGESKRFELDWKSSIPADRHHTLEAGLDSVWLLLGSMQQKRAEVLALPNARPPEVGWRLAPRGTNLARYWPLIWAGPLAVVSGIGPDEPTVAATVGVLALVALSSWVMVTSSSRSLRRKIERRYMVIGTLVLTWVTLSAPSLVRTGYPLALYVLGAFVLATPGWLSVVATSVRGWRDRFSRHPSSEADPEADPEAEAEAGAAAPPAGRAGEAGALIS